MNKMLTRALASSLVLLSAQAAVADNGISYDFIELHYVDTEDGNVDGDGLSFGGSYRLSEKVYLRGEYQDLEIENRIDVRAIELGAGYIYPYDALDIIGEVNYIEIDTDVRGGDDDGFLFTGGVRTYLTPKLEGRASLNHIRLDDNDTYVQLGAGYMLTNAWSIDGTYDLGGDADVLTIGARYSF